MVARNLLGRLNARAPDDLQRIAAFWLVPLPGGDRGRHVGALYRAMTDIRHARSVWGRLDREAQAIARDLALAESGPLTIDEIAGISGLSPAETRAAAIRLFQAGLLAREGDNQELPVGALPRLFLPREIGQVFRRVQDEVDAGDLSASALRVMLETLDDPELEEAATVWGITVIPGQRRRADLVARILRQIGTPDRVDQVVGGRGRAATALWRVVRAAAPSAMPLPDALREADLAPPEPVAADYLRRSARIEDALAELETSLLVFHTYLRDGSRWLFVPHEIAHPGETAATLPLRPLQPLPDDKAPDVAEVEPHMLAWDLLTLLREIAEHGAPVWVPGEPLSRSWQRRLNRRLWAGGNEMPPRGYLGFLLYLGVAVGVVRASDQPLPPGTDKNAIRPAVSPGIREWTRLTFGAQHERLKEAWLASDVWIEGREREEIDVWGADWRGFRRHLLEAIAELDPSAWFLVDDLAARLAEQNPTMIGATFTAASSRAARGGADERTAAIAQVIEVELETALGWFGVVQLGVAPGAGEAVTVVLGRDEPEEAAAAEPALDITEDGLVTLRRPTPLHVWSLSAFGDAERLRPEPVFQLRPGSVSRALSAGFDLDQITKYLDAQGGGPLPDPLAANLRDWTVGYKRVRLRRAVVLNPDSDESIPDLRDALAAAGLDVLDELTPEGDLVVVLNVGADTTAPPEEELLAALRAQGYVGQWEPTRQDSRKR
ncbi:MAG: hypothetical protein H0V37_10120 [Chloroflexia bacterium]|nr:hypothetical protein [Chloroflexia bacterium]